jgi:LmbE family N-acetylglucosaminyl deacetylase
MTMKSVKYIFFICILLFPGFSQKNYENTPFAGTSSDTTLVLLSLSAHPDDEDGATLAYYSILKRVKCYSIFYTRGEGGQNEIGPELNGALGRIREQETIEAAKILHSIPLFLGFLDFGYSKTAKETFRKWGGIDSVLATVVLLIREIRPDVIITNHDTITTLPGRQHGNHQAVGITAYLAFDKAADPNYHPEQFRNGIGPWRVKKLFFRVFDTTGVNPDSMVTIDVSRKTDDGTIEDLSIRALAKHRTQGMDKIDINSIPPYFRVHRYQLIRSNKRYPFSKTDLFSGIKPKYHPDLNPQSFATIYSYTNISAEDSLRILKEVKWRQGINIGLVNTYDNTIANTLNAFQINYTILDSNSLRNSDLSQYSTIILDIRTYFYRPDAERYNSRLLDYTRNGGNLLCFYQKPGDWNYKNIPPYPLFISSERVTEEDAKVTVLKPDHPFFNTPNEISAINWDGWVQERSIYLPAGDTAFTSPVYERLLAMSDEDEIQPSTSLLWAKYGTGTYTYCSLALYRQLRIFNEGALKLFMNLISQ